jgi:NAD(P)-dependent dehydrogenase (short-subunit alcohol dehydrogenase family)
MTVTNGQRNLIVTGAAGGMGSEVLKLLAQRNANVVCVDLDESAMAEVIASLGATEGEFVAVGADAADEHAVERYVADAVERWGGLDGLFNIAGTAGDPAMMTDTTIDNYDKVMWSNARTVFINVKFTLPHLIERGGGAIVSTGSYLAVRGSPACGSYGASKHAVVGLTKTLAIEVARQNVRANVVCPGSMDTNMIRELYPAIADDPAEAEAMLLNGIPQGRFAQPQELASTGVWLLLDAPSHLTGQVLMVDGGATAA